MAFKYNYSDRTRFKIAGGFYSQNLISARSDRDVVDLFYGFLSGPPDQTLIDFKGEETNHKLQKSKHLILGIEHDLFRGFTINLEGYYKVFPQLTNLNRYKIYDASNVPPGTPPHLEYSDYIVEKGEAMGLTFL